MKYALLIDFGLENCNYGDYAQSIALEFLYRKMGIPQSDIIYLSYKDLAEYNGESLLLPYSYVLGYLMDPKTERVRLSKSIIPVFLGVSIGVGFTRPLEVFTKPENGWMELFRNYGPIGCRDETTRAFFEQLGILAYLQGCITNILPKRTPGSYEKLMLVDCPLELLPFVPPNMRAKAEVLSNAEDRGDLTIPENYMKIKKRYQYYRDNAMMVVTSRYHVATPCNAMGIPSVLTMRPFPGKAKDIRLDSLPPAVQLVSKSHYAEINWSPAVDDSEDLKEAIMGVAIARISTAMQIACDTHTIRTFFQPRIDTYKQLQPEEETLQDRLKSFLEANYALCDSGGFYIWAASVLLCEGDEIPLAKAVAAVNPHLKFYGWLDTYKSGTLCGYPIFKPDEIHLGKRDFIVVATGTVIPFAQVLFRQMGLNSHQYHIYFDQMICAEDLRKAQTNEMDSL